MLGLGAYFYALLPPPPDRELQNLLQVLAINILL